MTLHDMWAFCGSEHLSIDSPTSQFRLGYDSKLDSDFVSGINLNKYAWKQKMKYWKDNYFTIVTPSRWLSQCARESALFSHCNI
ncbi:hypothetical protein, partial [Vibrio harveyi]|uniref:hypothetical protein n=1 Tax=Vibrio harveyi TaxID=669 RepID=UPI000B215275